MNKWEDVGTNIWELPQFEWHKWAFKCISAYSNQLPKTCEVLPSLNYKSSFKMFLFSSICSCFLGNLFCWEKMMVFLLSMSSTDTLLWKLEVQYFSVITSRKTGRLRPIPIYLHKFFFNLLLFLVNCDFSSVLRLFCRGWPVARNSSRWNEGFFQHGNCSPAFMEIDLPASVCADGSTRVWTGFGLSSGWEQVSFTVSSFGCLIWDIYLSQHILKILPARHPSY